MTYQNGDKKYLSFYDCTGTGYENCWYTNCHARYRCIEGARNTKKSYVMGGLEVISKILTDPRRNILIIRKTADSNRSSTYNTIVSLINQPDPKQPDLTLRNDFKINSSSMEITYKPTGQTISFKGMQDPAKITSTRPQVGFLTDVYVEEAFELDDYEAWRKVDGSIRGKLPDGLFLQITFILNPWNKDHWIYEKFFKGRLEDNVEILENKGYMEFNDEDVILEYGRGLFLHKSAYLINEFRDKDIYDKVMAEYKKSAYEIYKVEGLGCWGNTGEKTYAEFNEEVSVKEAHELNNLPYAEYAIGIDTGLSNGQGKIKPGDPIKSATTMQLCAITRDNNKLVGLGEYFQTNGGKSKPNQKNVLELQQEIVQKLIDWCIIYSGSSCLMKGTINVYVDSADIGFRQGLEITAKSMGLYNCVFIASTKKTILTRVMFEKVLMAFGDLLISKACPNLIREIKASHKGDKGEIRADGNDHAINAHEYAWTPIIPQLRRWKSFKER